MSVHEKCLLNSLEFDVLWKHIWLSIPSMMDGNGGLYHFYNTCKNKYNKYILRDGGITLKKLIDYTLL